VNVKVGSQVRSRLDQLHRFFASDVWETRVDELPRGQALGYRAARIAHTTLRSLVLDDLLHVRAAALTYYTVLSLVPLLAFAFALVKGLGAYDLLVEQTIRPSVLTLLAGNEPLRRAFEQILEFVGQTGVTSLGLVGLLTLLYAATRLLRNIEGALNEIWGASEARDVVEQVRDYVAIIVVTPLCLLCAATLTTVGQALDMVRAAGATLGLRALLDPLIGLLGPLLVLFVGLLVLYIVMPNTRVRVRSALLGAVIGGLAWYVVLIAHVRFQVGVARFNALYSSFGAVPIFLAWLQLSWLVVLVGAQIAATHQHSRGLAQTKRLGAADQAVREAVCLSALLRIARAFMNGEPRPRLLSLSAALDVPEALLAELLDRLALSGLLAKTDSSSDPGYVLALAPERFRVKDVLDALRRTPGASPAQLARRLRLDSEAERLWLELDRALADSPVNCSFRELLDDSAHSAPRSA
jgi:membrane protein